MLCRQAGCQKARCSSQHRRPFARVLGVLTSMVLNPLVADPGTALAALVPASTDGVKENGGLSTAHDD